MIHGLVHYSDECMFFDEFGAKYAAYYHTKNHGSNPISKRGFQIKQANHTIIENMVDEIHMVESKNVSAVNHDAPEFLETQYDENNLYQVENMSLDETEEKIE